MLKLYPRPAEKAREAVCLPLFTPLHVSRIASILTDNLDDDPFGQLLIEFAIEEARPASKVDPAISDRQDDLVMRASGF